MDFDKLSRGQQYLRLLSIEFEYLVRIARSEIDGMRYLMKHYANTYNYTDAQRMEKQIEVLEKDIEYYSKFIREDGAENEEILTESHDSESPMDRYKGPTCTTV